jgi:hypothetical protein
MTISKSGKKIVRIWGIVCILAISACFLFSPIQSQKAYAETKKVSGTIKFLRLAMDKTAIADCAGFLSLSANHGILSSMEFSAVMIQIGTMPVFSLSAAG